ncbi:hypothetical protein YC2023_057709 [Brassica napus]
MTRKKERDIFLGIFRGTLIRPKREGWLWPGVGYDPRRQTALLELRWIERIVKRCGMALDIPKI